MICTAIEAVPGVRSLRGHPGTELVSDSRRSSSHRCSSTRFWVRIELDLADAVGHWHPGLRGARTLPPDWVGPSETSLVQSAPIGALYNAMGRSCSDGQRERSR